MVESGEIKLPYLYPTPPRAACDVGSGVDRYLLALDSALDSGFPRIESAICEDLYREEVEALSDSKCTEGRKGRTMSSYLPLSLKLMIGYTRETLALRRELCRVKACNRSFIHVNRVGCEVQTIAARLAGYRRVITTVHNLPGEDTAAKHWLRRCIEWLSFACANHHICVSEATYETWRNRVGLRREKVTVVYNGMEEPDYSGFDRDTYRRELLPDQAQATWVGMCARLHPMKGHSVLLEAWAALQQAVDCEKLVLVLAGSGSLDSELKEQVKLLGLEQSVHFLGHRTDALDFARSIDLNVLPSVHSETLGYGLIEAMFAGRPSVVSDVGGMKELVVASQSGCVVPARDVSALAESILSYIKSPERMEADGLRAQRYAREYLTAQKMAEATLKVYAALS